MDEGDNASSSRVQSVRAAQSICAPDSILLEQWMDSKLSTRNVTVSNLFEDLRDGVILNMLLSEMPGECIDNLNGLNANAKFRIEKVENMKLVFKALHLRSIKINGINLHDVVDGQVHATAALVRAIMQTDCAEAVRDSITTSPMHDVGSDDIKLTSSNKDLIYKDDKDDRSSIPTSDDNQLYIDESDPRMCPEDMRALGLNSLPASAQQNMHDMEKDSKKRAKGCRADRKSRWGSCKTKRKKRSTSLPKRMLLKIVPSKIADKLHPKPSKTVPPLVNRHRMPARSLSWTPTFFQEFEDPQLSQNLSETEPDEQESLHIQAPPQSFEIDLKKPIGVALAHGGIVKFVAEDAQAAMYGVHVGSVIISVDNTPIQTPEDVQAALKACIVRGSETCLVTFRPDAAAESTEEEGEGLRYMPTVKQVVLLQDAVDIIASVAENPTQKLPNDFINAAAYSLMHITSVICKGVEKSPTSEEEPSWLKHEREETSQRIQALENELAMQLSAGGSAEGGRKRGLAVGSRSLDQSSREEMHDLRAQARQLQERNESLVTLMEMTTGKNKTNKKHLDEANSQIDSLRSEVAKKTEEITKGERTVHALYRSLEEQKVALNMSVARNNSSNNFAGQKQRESGGSKKTSQVERREIEKLRLENDLLQEQNAALLRERAEEKVVHECTSSQFLCEIRKLEATNIELMGKLSPLSRSHEECQKRLAKLDAKERNMEKQEEETYRMKMSYEKEIRETQAELSSVQDSLKRQRDAKDLEMLTAESELLAVQEDVTWMRKELEMTKQKVSDGLVEQSLITHEYEARISGLQMSHKKALSALSVGQVGKALSALSVESLEQGAPHLAKVKKIRGGGRDAKKELAASRASSRRDKTPKGSRSKENNGSPRRTSVGGGAFGSSVVQPVQRNKPLGEKTTRSSSRGAKPKAMMAAGGRMSTSSSAVSFSDEASWVKGGQERVRASSVSVMSDMTPSYLNRGAPPSETSSSVEKDEESDCILRLYLDSPTGFETASNGSSSGVEYDTESLMSLYDTKNRDGRRVGSPIPFI